MNNLAKNPHSTRCHGYTVWLGCMVVAKDPVSACDENCIHYIEEDD